MAASDQVVIGAIPQQPPGFQPRPYLLGQLNRTSRGVSALTGVRGAGKTELAGAYARAKLAAGWRLVAWINAGDTGSLLGGLAAVAEAAGLSDGSGRDAVAAGRAMRRWLEADGDRRLLVFDNADDPDVLRPFIPTGAARVLITSIQGSMAELGASVPVDIFSRDEALAIMVGRTALDDEAGAAAVSAELGNLPLALTQAATVIAGTRLGYQTYLERLRALPAGGRLTPETGQPYPHGAAEAVLLSLDEARASDQTGICARVMEIMAVLSAAGVRRDMLHAAGRAGVLAGVKRKSPVNETLVDWALERLVERSLLTLSLDGQMVVAYRLVLRVMRGELERRERWPAIYRAVARLLGMRAKALKGSPDRPIVRDLITQLTALLDNVARPAAEIDDDTARTLLADIEQVLGPNHRDTLGSRDNLAATYQAAGRAAEAIPLFQQILAARERLLGPDHPDTLTSRNNLAASYQDAGWVIEAIPLFEQTLTAREQVLGADHPGTVHTRRNLADAYRAAGRVAEAQNLAEPRGGLPRERRTGSGR